MFVEGEIIMEVAAFVLSLISTIAAVVSAVVAVSAKNEVHKLRNRIDGDQNAMVSGNISITNEGENKGIISGVNTGDIRK